MRTRALAAGLSVAAAFLWATYYVFILSLSATPTAVAVVFYPFVFGGLGYLVWIAFAGHARSFVQVWREPLSYLRVALLVGMQFSVVAATYLLGPVDASLLSLVGDVVVTPLIVLAFFAPVGGAHQRAVFWVGLALAAAGGSLTIVGGATVRPVAGLGWLVAAIVPVTVAFYFLLTARANRGAPGPAVVGQSLAAAAGATLVVAAVSPGGLGSLALGDARDLGLLALTGLTSFTLAPALYFSSIERVGLFLPALLMVTIPIFTLSLALALLGLVPPWAALAGIPIALAGAVAAASGEHEPWNRLPSS